MYNGTVVNRQYWHSGSNNICLEDLLQETKDKINLIVAYSGYEPQILSAYRDKINAVIDMDSSSGINIAIGQNEFTYEWLRKNINKFQNLFDKLQDDLSRRTMLAWLNQTISADYKYLERVKQKFQYFDEEINKMSEHEVFVDCGAYDGDSATAFIYALQRRGYTGYDEIISFEPDPDNFARLRARNLKNHTCIPKGVGSENKTFFLSQGGTSSKCAEDGEIRVEVESIDRVVKGGRVTMIKMDVEGAELDALHGAERTIKKYKPLLAICVYHRREDLLTIPQYIQSIVPGYKLFLRAYERTATELVLYAVV